VSYHSIHLEFPANAPFDHENWFETFVGHFVKPLLATGLVKQFWFTRYGNDQRREIRLRLTTHEFAALETIIKKQIGAFGFTDLNDEPNVTVFGTFGDDRALSPDAPNQSQELRGQLMLNIHHAIAALLVDTLIGPDENGRFRQEKNTNGNNPHGSVFETVHHLLCNTTNVVTEVELFKWADNILGVQSPLYAPQMKEQIHAQGVQVTDLGKLRVRF
jgi:hypothetical protein